MTEIRVSVRCPDCKATGVLTGTPGPAYYCTRCGSTKQPEILRSRPARGKAYALEGDSR